MGEMEIVRHRQVSGLSIFVNQLDHRTVHMHPEWELVWVLENPLCLFCGPEIRKLEPGQMVLFTPNEPHGFQKAQDSCTFLCLQISPQLLPLLSRIRVRNRFVHEVLSASESAGLGEEIKGIGISFFEREPLYELDCLGRAVCVLHGLLKRVGFSQLSPKEWANQEKNNNRIHRLIQYVEENCDRKIRLQDFAEAEGCSVSYLSRFVRETLNQTFREYVTSVRFDRACDQIAQGMSRMLDVCNEAGFSDYRYFTREFCRQFGVTPEEYAKNAHRLPSMRQERHKSLHSVERICTAQESLKILRTK